MEEKIFHAFSLNYKNPEYERAYKADSTAYTRKMLFLFFYYILLAIVVALCKNLYLEKDISVLRTIILGIFLVLTHAVIQNYSLQSKTNLDIGFICLIIFIFAMHLWVFFPGLYSTYSKNYLFFLGSALESIRVFLFISKIRWYFVLTANLILNFMILQNSIYIKEFDNQANLFPIIFPIIMGNTLPILIYFQERNDRSFFHRNLNFDKTLKSFEVLINEIMPNQLIILDKTLQSILFCNQEVKNFYDSQDHNYIYKRINSILVADENSNHPISLLKKGKSLDSNIFLNFQSSIPGKNTSEDSFFNIKFGRIHWQNEEAFLILLSDISAMKLVHKLKELDAYKDQLLATVSHDLRTPLNGLKGILELLAGRLIDKELLKYLKIASRCSNLLLFMINDILDFSQITNGKLRLNFSKYQIPRLIKEVFNMVKFQIEGKQLQLILDLPFDLKVQFLLTDYRRVQQVLLNLISNAMKFTNEGFIKLTIRKKNSANKKIMLEFSVEDTGIGIRAEDLHKLFHLFGKLDLESPHMNRTGVGLGLVISKRLVELLSNDPNAVINVESQFGKGTRFSFELPFEIPEEEDVNEEFNEEEEKVYTNFQEYRRRVNSPNLKSVENTSSINSTHNLPLSSDSPYINAKKILIVDDDQISLFIIGKYLESFGLKYQAVSDGKKAIEMVMHEKSFDLILMDCNMPIMNGFEASRRIKNLVYKKKIYPLKILALTANTTTEDIDECKESGMDDYLAKPIGKKEFKEKLQEILKIKILESNKEINHFKGCT